ncbi:MAG: NAD(P)-binding protein, partial [Pseudomonadota bacterium]|nr:NAD(P)-binding protein [Pseudomonadota bacterium]
MRQKNFDITICGGGMVGMALANSLAKNDFSVAIIENKRPKNFDQKQDFDLRVSAITRDTIDFFKNLDVWEYINDKRLCALHSMRVWEES